MLRSIYWLAMALVVVAGCAPEPEEVVEEGQKSVDSWSKTLEMVCRQWADYGVPTLYVKQMMKAGEEGLGKQLENLEKVSSDRDAQKVIRKIHRIRFWIEQNEEKLGEADGERGGEILDSLGREGEAP